MKTGIVFALVISLTILCQYQNYSKPAEPQVKGGYKSFTVKEFRYNAVKQHKKGEITYIQILDEKGNKIESISYGEKNKAYKNKIENKYNSVGLLSEMLMYNIEGKQAVKFTYNYDEKKNLITDITYDNKGKKTANVRLCNEV